MILVQAFDNLHNWATPVLSAWPQIGIASVVLGAGMYAACGYLARVRG